MNHMDLEKKIAYTFRDKSLIQQALTHSSYANEHGLTKLGSNERLEYLGDAVLELISSEFFYHTYPKKPEGELTKLRASFVCEPALSHIAEEIGLPVFILLGKGEERTGGRKRPSIVSDAFEALIGAIYLDGGFASAKEFIYRFVLNDVEEKEFFYDSKTILQEEVQKKADTKIEYRIVAERGPDHDKEFEICLLVDDIELGRAKANSKKNAEQRAAYEALKKLGKVK